MKTVVLTDAELVTAQLPEGHTYWSEEARTLWLASKGIMKPYREISDPKTKTHTFEMPEQD